MIQAKFVKEVILEGLQQNLYHIQTKYEYLKKREDISQYQDKITSFGNCYTAIEKNTNQLIFLIENKKLDEAKSFYSQTYKKDFQAILPLLNFFSIKTIKSFK